MSISLSSGMIYFGIICFLISIMIFTAQHKEKNRVGSNKALNDRIIFFKNKWQKEHWNLILIATAVVVGSVILGVAIDVAAFIFLGGVSFLGAYIYLYNKMMIYVEANAFNGKGLEEDDEANL